jgi:hypothetical protein
VNIEGIDIRPIAQTEWLPDRCLKGIETFIPNSTSIENGCPSLNYFKKLTPLTLKDLYKLTIDKFGNCGYVAWENDKVIAYHNFFPLEIAQDIRFFGFGGNVIRYNKILIHNCLTILGHDYLRKGICTALVKNSINWAIQNGWEKFEVHMVLPNCDICWQSDQKSCTSFWERLGFKIDNEYEADKETKEHYHVVKRYSMSLSLV